ncbi:MAG: DsrE family protein [Polyangiales bacterium]
MFASTSFPAETSYEDFPPVVDLIEAIMAGGGKVMVCGHCAEVSGVDLSTLLPGVVVSEHGSLLDELTPGMVSFSY